MTIKDVEQSLGVPRATLRFYEKEKLISPQRSENGYREYSDSDLDLLKKIIIFRKLGLSVTDIENILDGAKPLSEAIDDNIANLEMQMKELKGALMVCEKIRKEHEEIETFEAEKYWNVIETEENKGNPFLDIAKDMVHFEKSLLLEYFNLADRDGNLSESVPNAVITVILIVGGFIAVPCIINKSWSIENMLSGLKHIAWVLILQTVIGIPVFLIGRKHPDVMKKRQTIMFLILLGLLVLCILIIILPQLFA